LVALTPDAAAQYARQGLGVKEYRTRRVVVEPPTPILPEPAPVLVSDKVAIVLGGANDVLAEYEKAAVLCAAAGARSMVLATNDMIEVFAGRIDHAVTLHQEVKLPIWMDKRAKKELAMPAEVWAPRAARYVTRTCAQWGQGSVGLYAVKIALRELGCRCILLCGVPMTLEGNHFRRQRPWKDYHVFRKLWLTHKDEIALHVRSYAGWTAELLGTPTIEFVKSAQGVMQ
jgi:hypothetical protein